MADSDVVLIQKWIDGRDASAFEEVMRRYAGLVYATARRVLGNDAEAQDVTQECFIRLSRAELGVAKHLGGWLHRVATNQAITRLRAEKRRANREQEFTRTNPEVAEVAWEDVQKFVDDAINGLDNESRGMVVAYFIEKRTQESLAADLGVTRQTVSRRIQSGVEEIRHRLKEQGVTIGAAVFEVLVLSRPADAAPAALSTKLAMLAIAGGRAAGPAAGATATLMSYMWKAVAVIGIVAATGALWYTAQHARHAASGPNPAPIATRVAASGTSARADSHSAQDARSGNPVQTPVAQFGGSAVTTASATASTGTGSLIGHAVNGVFNGPVPGLTITFDAASGGASHTVTTDAGGTFRIDGLAIGSYRMNIISRDYTLSSDATKATLTISQGGAAKELMLTVTPRRLVRGRVFDRDSSKGIPDVPIAATKADEKTKVADLTARTNDDGLFAFQAPAEGSYKLSHGAVADYFPIVRLLSDDERTVEVFDEHTDGDTGFPMSRGGGMHGRVTLSGEPVANASFDLVCYVMPARQDDQIAHIVNGVKTDATGNYVVGRMPVFDEVGLFMLRRTASAEGDSNSLKTAALVKSGQSTAVDFQFTAKTALIEGHVHSAKGVPLTAGYIGADSVYGVPQSIFQGKTDQAGYFFIEHLPATQVHFDFSVTGSSGYQTLNVVLGEGQHVERDIVVWDTKIRCRSLNVPTNSKMLMYEVFPLSYKVPAGFDIPSLHERSDNELAKYYERGGGVTITGLEPGTYTVIAYSRTFELRLDIPEGFDNAAELRKSAEVLQQVTIEDEGETTLTFDFGAPVTPASEAVQEVQTGGSLKIQTNPNSN